MPKEVKTKKLTGLLRKADKDNIDIEALLDSYELHMVRAGETPHCSLDIMANKKGNLYAGTFAPGQGTLLLFSVSPVDESTGRFSKNVEEALPELQKWSDGEIYIIEIKQSNNEVLFRSTEVFADESTAYRTLLDEMAWNEQNITAPNPYSPKM